MFLFPAIDLFAHKAVRLYKGDYAQMTVYSDRPVEVAADFVRCGASHIHLVDLEGAKSGETPNFDTVCAIKKASGCFCEVGGGVRSLEVVERYLSAGLDRVILGTAAVKDADFLRRAVAEYGDRIAVGVDIKDGYVAVRGWTEKSALDAFDFCRTLEGLGVRTVICTDISKDGAMRGTNRELYGKLSETFGMQIVASGGVSSLDDVKHLRDLNLYGAIIGKAYYTGALDLKQAISEAER